MSVGAIKVVKVVDKIVNAIDDSRSNFEFFFFIIVVVFLGVVMGVMNIMFILNMIFNKIFGF